MRRIVPLLLLALIAVLAVGPSIPSASAGHREPVRAATLLGVRMPNPDDRYTLSAMTEWQDGKTNAVTTFYRRSSVAPPPRWSQR